MGLKAKFSTTLVATTSTVPIHPGVTVILPILGHHLQEPLNSSIHTYSTEQLMNLNTLHIQVVPGQAGGGSFKREKDLYSKERICL